MFEVGQTYEDRTGRPVRVLAKARVQTLTLAIEDRLIVLTNHGDYDEFGSRFLDGRSPGGRGGDLIDPSPSEEERKTIALIFQALGMEGEAGRLINGSPLDARERKLLETLRALSNS
jgi:hypothetical protein